MSLLITPNSFPFADAEKRLNGNRLSPQLETQKNGTRTQLHGAVDFRALQDHLYFGSMLSAFGEHVAKSKMLWSKTVGSPWQAHMERVEADIWRRCASGQLKTGSEIAHRVLGHTGEFVVRTLIHELLNDINCPTEHLQMLELRPQEVVKQAVGFAITGTRIGTLALSRRNKIVEYDHLLVQGNAPDALWFVETTASQSHLNIKRKRSHDLLSSLKTAYAKQARALSSQHYPDVRLLFAHLTNDSSTQIVRQPGVEDCAMVQLPLLPDTLRMTRDALMGLGYDRAAGEEMLAEAPDFDR